MLVWVGDKPDILEETKPFPDENDFLAVDEDYVAVEDYDATADRELLQQDLCKVLGNYLEPVEAVKVHAKLTLKVNLN